jgi:hypothetical protein
MLLFARVFRPANCAKSGVQARARVSSIWKFESNSRVNEFYFFQFFLLSSTKVHHGGRFLFSMFAHRNRRSRFGRPPYNDSAVLALLNTPLYKLWTEVKRKRFLKWKKRFGAHKTTRVRVCVHLQYRYVYTTWSSTNPACTCTRSPGSQYSSYL